MDNQPNTGKQQNRKSGKQENRKSEKTKTGSRDAGNQEN